MNGQADALDRVAGQVCQALEAADLDAYAGLLDPAVRWGPPGDPVPPCRSREQVLAWYRRARDSGARVRVTDTLVAGDKILIGLKVTSPAGGEETDRWQVLTVHGGRITAVTGFAERSEAAIWAGLTPLPPAPRGAIRWAAPRHQLTDDRIGLRLPERADAAVLHDYAARDGGLDGGWVPLPAGATLADCQAVVDDWLAGWRNERSYHGPALIITPSAGLALAGLALAGLVGLGDRGGRVAELSYGIAPDWRGRGYAASAARLTAGWLLRERHAGLVELRIAPANTASQRAALAAGFTLEGTVRPPGAATGEPYDDLRFILRP